MRKVLLLLFLTASQAEAQTQLAPKASANRNSAGARTVDICAPIGRTAKGELVYSMKCDNLPVPPPSAQAEVREVPVAAPPPEPEARGGIFGWSYDRRPKSE